MPDPDPLPAIKTPWGSATPPSGASAGGVPPIPIPDHTLIRRIGRGSYGEVWLARNALGVYRAVKIVDRRAFDDDRPFEREFAGMQRFEPVSRSHESQLNILQVGRGPHCFYYVMELADDMGGDSLNPDTYTPRNLRSELLLRGRLPVDECVRLGLALTTALEHLHRHGLVHRDVKPSNIVFVNGIPKLADIGLVALAESTMSFVGTEGYLPPEGPGSVQADLFSLGKVLYEISTGRDRQQFPELPTGISELPDRAALAEFNEVLLRACAPDVKKRYESAAEMHADLALLQSGKSVSRMRAVERRLKFVARAGAVVAGIALLAGAAFLYQQAQTREARRLASENKALAEAKTQLADDKSKLAEENRERLVRLDIANGVRLLDEGDASGALLWFADALPLVTNNPAEEAIHRIRIQQALSQSPRLLRVFGIGGGGLSGALSPDGRRLAIGTYGHFSIWDVESGEGLIKPRMLWKDIHDLRFTKDGKRVLARSCTDQGLTDFGGKAAVLDAATAEVVFPSVSNAVRTAFSPDDRWLAVGRRNHVIELLDAASGRHLGDFSGHTNEITMLSFSRDSALLASASRDQTVRLWRVPSGEPVGPPIRHSQSVGRAVFSPDARRLATATEAPVTVGQKWCFIHTWDVASGAEIGSPIQAASSVRVLTFDETADRRLITADINPWITVRDADSHAALFAPLRFDSPVRCWAFSLDGLRFAAGSDDGTACVWSLETGEPIIPRLRHAGYVNALQFSPDGTRLLTTSEDLTAKIWDLTALPEAAKPLRLDSLLVGEPVSAFPHAMSPDGHRLIVVSREFLAGKRLFVLRAVNLDTLTVEGAPLPSPDEDFPGQIQFDNSGRQWAAALGFFLGSGRSGSISLWRREGEEVRLFTLPHPKAVTLFQFSADGEQIFSLGDDQVFRAWHTTNGTLATEVKMPDDFRSAIAISPDGKRVLGGWKNSDLRLFDVENPQANTVLLTTWGAGSKARFSPEGQRFVWSWGAGHISDARTGQALTPPFTHGGSVSWIEWSPDGRRVLTAGESGWVKLWDAATGEPLLAPMGSKGSVRVAHFSPDGRFLVTRCDDHTARVWDAARTEAVTPMLHHDAEVWVALLTTNNRLVTVSGLALIRAWDLTETRLPAALIADYARLLAGRKLDRAGALQPLSAKELDDLGKALRAAHPELFTRPTEELREWHRRQVQEPTSLARVTAGLFHLDRLAGLDPGNPWVKEQQVRFRACQIPSRAPGTAANLVDLSDFYTLSFGVLPGKDLADLPRGVQSLTGTPFDLRGMVRLQSENWTLTIAPFPVQAVSRIPVGRHCRQLHFLQGVDGAEGKDGEEVARWVIHYADGTSREWPVIYGEHVRDWWRNSGKTKEASQAAIAWEGHPPMDIRRGAESVRLFKATWTNPLPEVEVSHLDFVLGKVDVRPFVVAITAE